MAKICVTYFMDDPKEKANNIFFKYVLKNYALREFSQGYASIVKNDLKYLMHSFFNKKGGNQKH